MRQLHEACCLQPRSRYPTILQGRIWIWYDTLSADLKNDLESPLENFKAYFDKTELDYVFADETVFTRLVCLGTMRVDGWKPCEEADFHA